MAKIEFTTEEENKMKKKTKNKVNKLYKLEYINVNDVYT